MTTRPILITIFLMLSVGLFACDCTTTSKTFKDNLNFPYILEVEILEHFQYEEEPNDNLVFFEGYTKLLVLKSLKSEIMYDTMLFKNGQGSNCEIHLGFFKPGERLLLKGWEAGNLHFYDLSGNPFATPSKQDSVFVKLATEYRTIESTNCEYTYLKISNQHVEGNLTRNKLKVKQKIYRILKKISYKLAKEYEDSSMNEEQFTQRMKLQKYWNILVRKMKIRR